MNEWEKIEELKLVAAAAAKSLQSCPTLCDPIDGSPPGSPAPGILQARVLEWGAIAFSARITREMQIKDHHTSIRIAATSYYWTIYFEMVRMVNFVLN